MSQANRFRSTKLFKDFPCTHRAWRYEGHCRFIHGYCRAFKFVFSCEERDENGWVMDFSGLTSVKKFLKRMFDHTFLAAEDDPQLELFLDMEMKNLIQLRLMTNPSIEGTADFVLKECQKILNEEYNGRIRIESVEVIENEKNSAIVYNSASF